MKQMMLGRRATCMCVSVDSSRETVRIMYTSIPVHLIGHMDLFFFLHELSAYIRIRLIFGKMQYIYI